MAMNFILPTTIPTASASLPSPEIEGQDEDEHQESEERKQEVEKAEVKEKEEQHEDEDNDEMRMYSAILSRNPGDVDALKCALYAKMRNADWGGALRYVRRLRDAEPGEVEWRLMVAQLHELGGDLAEAESQFREVLAEEPLLHVGITYMLLLI
ncbi:protein SLOW GREEN 1, chloroplastic-like [Panicum miliaceum]|uniref:Protein SLOW GREEN 1, chloroplastic-like n=1 Tax=Panicum miliaceum TaxID=4540 RepID=A0A3L6T710_PANMI|nr:protein SLOW GREEN 1, chloroplastic-like [Panicum miliaceum]